MYGGIRPASTVLLKRVLNIYYNILFLSPSVQFAFECIVCLKIVHKTCTALNEPLLPVACLLSQAALSTEAFGL